MSEVSEYSWEQLNKYLRQWAITSAHHLTIDKVPIFADQVVDHIRYEMFDAEQQEDIGECP